MLPYVSAEFLERQGRRPVDVFSVDGERLFSGFLRTRWEAAYGDFVYSYEQSAPDGEWRVVRYRLAEDFE